MNSTAYLSLDRSRGSSNADLCLVKLRAGVLASEALAGAAKKSSEKENEAPVVVEAAPFQKVE